MIFIHYVRKETETNFFCITFLFYSINNKTLPICPSSTFTSMHLLNLHNPLISSNFVGKRRRSSMTVTEMEERCKRFLEAAKEVEPYNADPALENLKDIGIVDKSGYRFKCK